MVRISKIEFQEMRKLGLIEESKHSKNYAKSRRYRFVQDDVYEDFQKLKFKNNS